MQKIWVIWILASLLCGNVFAQANHTASVESVISELEQGVKQSKKTNEITTILEYLHPQALIILENGRSFNSKDELKKFIKNPVYLNNVKIKKVLLKKFDIEKPIIMLSADSALIHGKAKVKYVLSNAKNLELSSDWTATLMKENDKWVVRSFQSTSNIFNNPMIDDAWNDFYLIIIVTLIIGAILGFLWKKIKLKK